MNHHVPETDLFIVGGGPAGLATAIFAAQKGFRVMVADHTCPPIDKACGEGLLPDTVATLTRLGVSFTRDEALPFRGIRFIEANSGLATQAAFPRQCGVAVRRTVLHARLLERASDVGVTFAWGARVTWLGSEGVAVNEVKIRSRWIVGADGQNSQLRKRVFPSARPAHARFASRQHFHCAPWTDFVEVYWGRTCQITVTPVGALEVGLAATSRNPHVKLRDALDEVPQLAARIAGAAATSTVRGAPTGLLVLGRVARGPFALVGDAAGTVDAITGEGLGLAFLQADSLTDALGGANLRSYQAAHSRISRIPRLMSRLLLSMDAYPWFRKRVLRALASEPQFFTRLLNVHIRAETPGSFGAANALRLGWRVLASPRA